VVLIVTLSPDFFSNAVTIAAMAFFGTASDAFDPRPVDFELLPPPPLLPVQAASSGRPARPTAPTAAPLSIVRRLGAVPPVAIAAESGAGMRGASSALMV
jgi:hypothetical protein